MDRYSLDGKKVTRAYNTGMPNTGIPVIFSGIQVQVLIQKYRFFGSNLKNVYDLFT
jgi:transcription termination factor Rho